jgi:hypothetical protein
MELTAQCEAWCLASKNWGALSTAQREAWELYAKSLAKEKDPFKQVSRAGYIEATVAAYLADQCGEDYPGDPPTTVAPDFPIGVVLDLDGSGNWRLSWDAGSDGDYVEVKWVVNGGMGQKIYDYRLSLQAYVPVGDAEFVGGASIAGRKGRASARMIRASGQAGPKYFVSAES